MRGRATVTLVEPDGKISHDPAAVAALVGLDAPLILDAGYLIGEGSGVIGLSPPHVGNPTLGLLTAVRGLPYVFRQTDIVVGPHVAWLATPAQTTILGIEWLDELTIHVIETGGHHTSHASRLIDPKYAANYRFLNAPAQDSPGSPTPHPPDLIALKTRETDTGYAEIHVLDGATQHQAWSAHAILPVTQEFAHQAIWVTTRSAGRRPDLLAIHAASDEGLPGTDPDREVVSLFAGVHGWHRRQERLISSSSTTHTRPQFWARATGSEWPQLILLRS